MQIFYDIILFLFLLFYFPIFVFKKKLNKSFFIRLGFTLRTLQERLKNKSVIWLHAVSVGELTAARSFIQELKRNFPDKTLVVSCVTEAANALAKKMLSKEDILIYSPLDFSFIARYFVKVIRPCIYICMETEIWPNIILELKKKNIPIVLINTRISNKSFKRYKKVKILLKNILNKIDFFATQTKTDSGRLVILDVEQTKVKFTGNMKFDLDYTKVSTQINLKFNPDDSIFIAGSTHPKEEKIILDIYKKLKKEFPNLKLIIAPRHIERVEIIEKLIKNYKFSFERLSQLKNADRDIILVDTIGQLSGLYSLADIVFVGGSLIKKGGHNILEPAYFAKPILFGPFMFNFQDITELFLAHQAAILVKTKEQFLLEMINLIKNPEKRKILGTNAQGLIKENQGATIKNINLVKEILK